jgi:hypothetical protein
MIAMTGFVDFFSITGASLRSCFSDRWSVFYNSLVHPETRFFVSITRICLKQFVLVGLIPAGWWSYQGFSLTFHGEHFLSI